jgi:hypothetical protein
MVASGIQLFRQKWQVFILSEALRLIITMIPMTRQSLLS